MSELIFHIMLQIGLIIPSGDVDGRPIYEVYNNADCSIVAEYAYKGEILQYIETKEWKYNEDLPDSTPIKFTNHPSQKED